MANTEQDTYAFHIARNIPYGDKLAHILVFGIFALLLNFSIEHKTYAVGGYPILWGSTFVLLFATLEEGSQYFVSSRTIDLFDFLASLFGILVFSFISCRIKGYLMKSKITGR